MLSTLEVLMEIQTGFEPLKKISLNDQKPWTMLKKLDYFQKRAAFFGH